MSQGWESDGETSGEGGSAGEITAVIFFVLLFSSTGTFLYNAIPAFIAFYSVQSLLFILSISTVSVSVEPLWYLRLASLRVGPTGTGREPQKNHDGKIC